MNRSRLLVLPLAALVLLLAAAPASAVYHPTLGRFLQRDPIGYADGLSLYEYTRSNPCAYHDPHGLAALGEVKLHSEVLQRHGTTEGFRPRDRNRDNLFMIPNEYDAGKQADWFTTHIWYNFWSQEDTHIAVDDYSGATWYSASFYAHTRVKPDWNLQMSCSIRTGFSIENVCCMSENLRVTAKCHFLKNAFCTVPADMVYRVEMGEKKSLPVGQEAFLGSDWTHFPDGRAQGTFGTIPLVTNMEAHGGLVVELRCEEW